MKQIKKKIVQLSLAEKPVEAIKSPVVVPEVQARESSLKGITYKIKPGEHAYYITINDIYVDGSLRPYEIFINSKDTGSRQWVDALTRVISAVLRKGGEYKFLVEELKVIADVNGGRFHKGKYITSMVAEIGYVLEEHIKDITDEPIHEPSKSPKGLEELGSKCKKCGAMAVVPKDGCPTCLACGESKCG